MSSALPLKEDLYSAANVAAAIEKPSAASPNYWCTWCTQSTCLAQTKARLAPLFIGDQGQPGVRDGLCEEVLFGKGGWVDFYPRVRSDLVFLLDDGWDVPYGAGRLPELMKWPFGSMELDPVRFPSFRGSPGAKLAELTRRVKDKGWRGSGLWVAIQSQAELGVAKWAGFTRREEWKRKLDWCAEGGVSYLKVDWGECSGDIAFRQMLTDLKNEIAPHVVVEHCHCQLPVNGMREDGTGGGRRLFGPEDEDLRQWERLAMKCSDAWRIYDWIDPLAMPQGIDRTVTDIKIAEETGSRTVVSTEDGLYIGAALGCAFGIMRSGARTADSRRWPSLPSRRLAEVDRAVRWERIAPAYAPRPGYAIAYSDDALFDSWHFEKGEFWHEPLCGRDIRQGAPARVSRGMPLPEVVADGEMPYVLCARNPSGAISVAAQPRVSGGKYVTPLADVRLDAALSPASPLGVFGSFRSVTIRCAPGVAVFARDLAGGVVRDITASVRFAGGVATLPGDLLARIGKEADDDDSMPGVLVWCEKEEDEGR